MHFMSLNVFCNILTLLHPAKFHCTYFPNIQFFQLYIQTYINFNVSKVSEISDVTWNISIESPSPSSSTTFSTNCFRCSTTGEKKKKKYREIRDAFSIADSNYAMVIMVITVRHISPAINSTYGISRVFTRIPATLRQQHRAVGKQRPRPY